MPTMLTCVGKEACYARANGIIKNFSMCSPVVKATLFRTFCSNMYCSQLWRDFKSCSITGIRKLIVGYNHSFRYIMNYHRNCSASGMFVFNSIYLVLWNCGETIVMVLCSDSTTATIQSSLPLFRPVGCHPLCGGAGSLFCTLKRAASGSFFYPVNLYLLFSLFMWQTLGSVLCICIWSYCTLNMGLRCFQWLAWNILLLLLLLFSARKFHPMRLFKYLCHPKVLVRISSQYLWMITSHLCIFFICISKCVNASNQTKK